MFYWTLNLLSFSCRCSRKDVTSGFSGIVLACLSSANLHNIFLLDDVFATEDCGLWNLERRIDGVPGSAVTSVLW